MYGELKLRSANAQDLSFIENLLQENQLPHQDILQKLVNLFIGYANSESIGIGGLEVYQNFGLLRSLVIDSSYRGKGYGKAFTIHLLKYAKSVNVDRVYLLTTTAATFFTQLGFEKIERSLAPSVIQNTSQFTSLCPASAICLLKEIST